MANENALHDAVQKAADHLEKGGSEDTVNQEDNVVETSIDEESEDEETPEDGDLDEAQLIEAKNLYKALKNPQSANAVVAALAQQAGLLGKNTPETKQEVVAAKKEITSILKESLGDEFAFLAPRIGKALEEIFSQEQAERASKDAEINQRTVEREAFDAMEKLAVRTKGESRKVEAKMAELSSKILPAPGMSADEYMGILYTQATAGRAKTVATNNLNDKIKRNANDVSSRLATSGGNRSNESVIDPNKKYSLRESIDLAMKQQQSNFKRK